MTLSDVELDRRLRSAYKAYRSWPLHIPFLLLLAYALHGVGSCCEDFGLALAAPGDPWFGYLLANPANILTHGLPLLWLGYQHQLAYDLLKFVWAALAYGMAYRFASLFFAIPRAALFAALFVLYPSHDATLYWFTSQYLMLTAAFYLYAFYLASSDRLWASAAAATLASFVSYGSTPWAVGLGLVFLLQRQFRHAAALVLPNLIYIGYYVVVTLWLGLGNRRLPETIHVEALLKQLVLQIAGGADAVLGPSVWLKTWYSIGSLTVLSALVGAALFVALVRSARCQDEREGVPRSAWLGVAAVAFSGFGMFALTGAYPQSAFGMGNRVVIYASFAAAFLLVWVARRAWSTAALTALLIFSSLGLSDHWRAWRSVQDETIEALRSDAEFSSGRLGTDTLFVVGHAYSRLGPIAHIAFLAQTWITDPVFTIALGERKTFPTVPLTSRFIAAPDALVDSKAGARYPIGDSVTIYDAQARRLRRIPSAEMPRFIAGLEPPIRHWIQLAQLAWVRDFILGWMPQLGYLWR